MRRGRLFLPNRVWTVAERPNSVTRPELAAALFAGVTPADSQEHFLVLMLDSNHKPMAPPIEVVKGVLDGCMLTPREVFGPALCCRAAAIIIAHNHPSGNLRPSEDDLEITRRFEEAGTLLGIHLLDHLIFNVGDIHGRVEPTHVSIREWGWPAPANDRRDD